LHGKSKLRFGQATALDYLSARRYAGGILSAAVDGIKLAEAVEMELLGLLGKARNYFYRFVGRISLLSHASLELFADNG
jgi:hypothetical protein